MIIYNYNTHTHTHTHVLSNLYFFTVTAQEGPGIVIAHPGQDVELLCTITPTGNRTAAWIINYLLYRIQQLHQGIIAGFSSNGNNLIIENIMMNDDRNNTEYQCVTVRSTATDSIIDWGDSTILYVAGEYYCSTDIMYVRMYAICSMVLKLAICM